MAISFLYNGIAAVYYALMCLGTTETIESLALALIPPGNVLRSVSEYRKYLWAVQGLPGARSWFDFPVIVWLGSPVNDAILAGIAADFVLPFELLAPMRCGNAIILPFPQAIHDFAAGMEGRVPLADSATPYRVGPFEAGLGFHCASLESVTEPGGTAMVSGIRFPLRARTCLLAQVSLTRTAGPEPGSIWRVVSTARVSGMR